MVFKQMSQKPDQAVIFDMDGVLTDSEPLINEASVKMFAELGVQVQPEDFYPYVGTGEKHYIGGVAEKYGMTIDLFEAKMRIYEIYLKLAPRKLVSFSGAIELVHRCRDQGWKIGVASSADMIKIEANMTQIGLPLETWDALTGADHVEHKKPAPDIFLAAAKQLELMPSQCVVIEDASHGVQAAKSAGMRCVAVTHTFSADRLAQADLIKETIGKIQLTDLFPYKTS